MWRFLKRYCASLNKVAHDALSSGIAKLFIRGVDREFEKGSRRVLDALDHALLHWTTELGKNMATVSHRQLELYFQQLIETAINKSLYHRRMGRVPLAWLTLNSVETVYRNARSSHNLDTQNLCARFDMTRGALMMDSGSPEQALDCFLESLRILASEQHARCSRVPVTLRNRWDAKTRFKARRNVISHRVISRQPQSYPHCTTWACATPP